MPAASFDPDLQHTRTSRTAILLVVAATVIRIVLAAVVPLFPDETYYWEWSRRLAAGYFDHPPAIAFLIHGGTSIAGATSLAVRAGAILAGAIASWAMVILAGRLASGPRDGAVERATPGRGLLAGAESRAALFAGIIPVALVGFVLATPDAPLLAAIALTLVALERAIAAAPRSRETLGWWIAAGVALGLAFCSKYTSVLVPMGVLVALIARPSLRPRLVEPGPYVATIVALLVFLPTLLWNAHNDWISFAFQLHHGLGAPRGSAITRELNLIGGQLGLVSPILAVMAAIAVAHALRRTASDRRFLLAVIATTIIAFFVVSALRKPVEANWPAPALVAAIPLLAAWDVRGSARKWLITGCWIAAAFSTIIAVHAATGILPLPARRDPIAKAHGWDDLAQAVSRARSTPRAASCSAPLFAADRYQDASELAYHLPDHPRVFALNRGGRRNQYDLWPSIYSIAQPEDCVLLVVDVGAGGDDVVRKVGAESATLITQAVLRWGTQPVARRAIWLLRGMPAAPPVTITMSPLTRALVDSATRTFAARSSVLDSVVHIFRHGPSPYLVPASDSGPPLSNADRRAAISARVAELHQILTRANALSVYRDSRYSECTFIRTHVSATVEVGYAYAPEGCRLRGRTPDPRVHVEPVTGDWYVYAVQQPM